MVDSTWPVTCSVIAHNDRWEPQFTCAEKVAAPRRLPGDLPGCAVQVRRGVRTEPLTWRWVDMEASSTCWHNADEGASFWAPTLKPRCTDRVLRPAGCDHRSDLAQTRSFTIRASMRFVSYKDRRLRHRSKAGLARHTSLGTSQPGSALPPNEWQRAWHFTPFLAFLPCCAASCINKRCPLNYQLRKITKNRLCPQHRRQPCG